MFGLRTRRVAEAVVSPSQEYGPGSAAYSPALTTAEEDAQYGRASEMTQADAPVVPDATTSDQTKIIVDVPEPPNPSEGGEPGVREGLGYTTGLLPTRALHQRFTGVTLVRPSMGVHPPVGPVGVSTRMDRLEAGVAGLVDQWLPSQQQINESFVGTPARNRNPLDKD